MTIDITIDRRQKRYGWPRLRRGPMPMVLAIFAFRYDSALVPDLITNIRPFVDGWVSLDDRATATPYSSDHDRRVPLIAAAIESGAEWILAVDPDERFEGRMVSRIHSLTAVTTPVVWGFNLRELYAPDRYRVDGVWGRKMQHRLFNLPNGRAHQPDEFDIADLHATWHPKGHQQRNADVNLYHLKMIDPKRRVARRDLYATLDPTAKFQRIGYEYLADETAARFRKVPPHRRYFPEHRDDGGLWMAEASALGNPAPMSQAAERETKS